MKINITILKWLSVLFLLRIIALIDKQIKNIYDLFHNTETNNLNSDYLDLHNNVTVNWAYTLTITSIILLLYLAYNIFLVIKMSNKLSKQQIFTQKNTNRLSHIGKGILIYAILLTLLKTVLTAILNFENFDDATNFREEYIIGYSIGSSIMKQLYLFVISFFILAIASIIKKGAIIQQENELTI